MERPEINFSKILEETDLSYASILLMVQLKIRKCFLINLKRNKHVVECLHFNCCLVKCLYNIYKSDLGWTIGNNITKPTYLYNCHESIKT